MNPVKKTEEIIREKAESVLERNDYFVVDVSLSGAKNSQKLSVLIDGDNGIDIDVCATVSRKLAAIIEELDLIQDKYILEVSSPGVDYPLTTERQFRKNIGRTVKAFLTDKKSIEGKLVDVKNDHFSIQKVIKKEGIKDFKISYSELEKIKVQVSFK
jgi:ribosome maturation factor RimP